MLRGREGAAATNATRSVWLPDDRRRDAEIEATARKRASCANSPGQIRGGFVHFARWYRTAASGATGEGAWQSSPSQGSRQLALPSSPVQSLAIVEERVRAPAGGWLRSAP
jgi:hypothetical protein